MNTLGFVILRCVKSIAHVSAWRTCYNSIRTHYPDNKIVIIDDNSDQSLIGDQTHLTNTIVVHSEFPGRGELLPYYYFAKCKWFDVAVFIQDSVFINKRIEFATDTAMGLWGFDPKPYWGEEELVIRRGLLSVFDNQELLDLFDSKDWSGMFGGMAVVNVNFIVELDSKFRIERLLDVVTGREGRCAFERAIGVLFEHMLGRSQHMFDNIHGYLGTNAIRWGLSYHEYLHNKSAYSNAPLVKVWFGR